MPYKSTAQRDWLRANKPEVAKKFEAHTDDLPERAGSPRRRLKASDSYKPNAEVRGMKGRY